MKHQFRPMGLWIFLSALLVRVVYFRQYVSSPLLENYGVDHVYYLTWANRIAAGDWLGTEIFEQAPLYAYLLGTIFYLLGERIAWVLMAQTLIGAGTCVLVYVCARRLFDHRTAAMAGFLSAIYGPFVFYECAIMKSFLSPFLSMVVLYAGLCYGDTRQLRWLWVAGITISLACLVRENHILLFVPFALWIWTQDRETSPPARQRVMYIGILALGISLCLAPTTVRNWYVGGELVVVTAAGGEAFYLAHGPWSNGYYVTPDFVLSKPGVEHEDFRREAERRTGHSLTRRESSQYWFHEGLRFVKEDPGRTVKLTFNKALILFSDFEVPDNADYRVARQFVPLLDYLPTFGWIGGLGFLGIAIALRNYRKFQLPLGIVAAHVLSVLILYNFGRFRLGMLPLWITFAAYGTAWLATAIQRTLLRHAPETSWSVVLGICLVSLITMVMYFPRQTINHEIHTASVTGSLALDSGDLSLAEHELRRALQWREQEIAQKGPTTTRYYNLARDHQGLALALLQTGRIPEAVAHLRLARQAPNRPEVKEEFLRFELAVLRRALLVGIAPTLQRELQAEADTVLAELRSLRSSDR